MALLNSIYDTNRLHINRKLSECRKEIKKKINSANKKNIATGKLGFSTGDITHGFCMCQFVLEAVWENVKSVINIGRNEYKVQ